MKEKISSIRLEYGDAVFRIYHIRLTGRRALQEMVSHDHQYYELHFAQQGEYPYRVDGKQLLLRANHLLIIPPGMAHESVGLPDDYRYAVLSLSLSQKNGDGGFYSYFKAALDRSVCTPIAAPPSLADHMVQFKRWELYRTVKGCCYLKARASALLFELFDLLGFAPEDGHRHADFDYEDRLILLDNLLNQHEFTLRDIAEQINYTPRHTARLIRKIYGHSLSELRKKYTASPPTEKDQADSK